MARSRRPCAAAWRRSARVFRSTSLTLALALLPAASPGEALGQTLEGPARVTDDGHLVVQGRELALFGIDLPTHDRTCRTTVSPAKCGPRAVLILAEQVRGFVHCDVLGRHASGLPAANCTVAGRRMLDDRIDLAAEMLREGWAFVRPEAPPYYHSLERLARTREIGMWDDATVNLR